MMVSYSNGGGGGGVEWSEEEAMGGDYYVNYGRKEAEKKKVVGSFYLVGKLRSSEFCLANVTSTQKGSLIG
jgi:hypothetical protein